MQPQATENQPLATPAVAREPGEGRTRAQPQQAAAAPTAEAEIGDRAPAQHPGGTAAARRPAPDVPAEAPATEDQPAQAGGEVAAGPPDAADGEATAASAGPEAAMADASGLTPQAGAPERAAAWALQNAPVSPEVAGRAADHVAQESVRHARMLREGESVQMRLQLRPPELGRVEVELEMKEGRVAVRMRVEDPGVRETMRDGLPDLQRSMRGAQLEMSRFDVTDFRSGHRGSGRQNRSFAAGPTAAADAAEVNGEGLAPVGWTRISAGGGVDCLV